MLENLIPRTPTNDELAHMVAELRAQLARQQAQIVGLATPPPPEQIDISQFVLEDDRRLRDARTPLRHGEGAHAGYIGEERNLKFDINGGHDHDGTDSKLISVPDAFSCSDLGACSIAALGTKSHTLLSDIGLKTHLEIDSHIASTANPHTVTAAQVNAVATADHTKAAHDALLIDADTLDTLHASAFAVAAKGVTNGDSHDHSGGDGAQIDHGGLGGLADDDHTLYALASKSRPATWVEAADLAARSIADLGTKSHTLLSDIGANTHAQIDSKLGYALTFFRANPANPADAATYYWGQAISFAISASSFRVYVPFAGKITAVYGLFFQTAGSAEKSALYLLLNTSTSITISITLDHSAAATVFSKTGLSQAVVAGDFLEFKWVTPTWATNPTGQIFQASVWVAT